MVSGLWNKLFHHDEPCVRPPKPRDCSIAGFPMRPIWGLGMDEGSDDPSSESTKRCNLKMSG